MKKTVKTLILMAILVLTILALAGCGKSVEKTIVGEWTKGSSTFTYNKDGTAVMNGTDAKYKIEGDKLYIEYPNISKTYEFTISIEDNKMTLTGKDGKKSEYIKKGV